MPAADSEPINGCLRVVGLLKTLCKDLCILINKITNIQPEAKKLRRQIEDDRENGLEASSDQIATEKGLYRSVRRCRTQLREMKRDFIPLEEIGGDEPASAICDQCAFVLDTKFFSKQQNEIEWQHRAISFEFNMMDYHQRRGEQARQSADRRADRAWFTQIANLVKECRDLPPEGPPSGPVSPANTTAEEEEDGSLGEPVETDMPDINQNSEDSSADSEDPIDTPVSQDRRAPVNLIEDPSREDALAELADQLMSAVKIKNSKTQLRRVKGLLQSRPPENVCASDDDDWTLLHHAVLQENPALLKLLLRHPQIREAKYLNAINLQGHTALMEACKRADHKKGCKMVQILLEHDDCEVNITDESEQERSALYFVVDRPANDYSILVAEKLMEKEASIYPVRDGLPERLQAFPAVNEAVERRERQREEQRGSRVERLRRSLVGNVLR